MQGETAMNREVVCRAREMTIRWVSAGFLV